MYFQQEIRVPTLRPMTPFSINFITKKGKKQHKYQKTSWKTLFDHFPTNYKSLDEIEFSQEKRFSCKFFTFSAESIQKHWKTMCFHWIIWFIKLCPMPQIYIYNCKEIWISNNIQVEAWKIHLKYNNWVFLIKLQTIEGNRVLQSEILISLLFHIFSTKCGKTLQKHYIFNMKSYTRHNT